jgi:primosomal protein N' (replication factor Y)
MLPGLRAAVEDARVRAARTRERNAATWAPADDLPVARVLLDLPLAHLDRPFDYAVPAAMAEQVVPGSRVKVRFAGQEVAGYVLSREAGSDHDGRLQPLRRAVSAEPVLSEQVAELCGLLARHSAGVRADVLRLAVPPRHAATERQPSPPAPEVPVLEGASGWEHVRHAEAFLGHVAAGAPARAVWSAAPGDDWPAMLARAAATAYAAGRGAVLCVPDGRDVDRLVAAVDGLLGSGHCAVLRADVGPAARYRQFLAVSRGTRRIVVGTRSAAFAPVADPGLFVIWDDGDESHAEPRAPYPHTRDVLRLRAEQVGAALLAGGFARSVETEQWVASGWAHALSAPREVVRERARVHVVEGQDRAVVTRVPRAAREAIREALGAGQPVLVQTPRGGYAPALACERCRTPARCGECSGPLRLSGPTAPPQCAWCGIDVPGWRCPVCHHAGLRAPVRGNVRTAEELGRDFAGTTVRSSHADHRVEEIGHAPVIVVATTGAEPVAEHGYGAVVILDTWLTLAHEDMRSEEEALRRWMGAAGLVSRGGTVVAVGEPSHPALQALVRWDPAGFAAREAAERAQAHLPPAARVATLTGDAGALSDALTVLALPAYADVLGPVPAGEEERFIVRVPARHGDSLAVALGELQRVRSARKLDPVRIQLDPPRL